MRKSQKNQILDTLELLDKAHAAIQKAIEAKNQDAAMTLLEQCQDSAIQIGSLIEASEGEDFEAIAMLEDYCEQIYQNYELIRQQQPINAAKICKGLRKELIRIENSVKNNISVRKTVVFLPYKASMWDSLESVWKAADADPECDAYVIPIPYFDKNPDGSFREEHYEGDQYPKYVPITRYDEFDLEAYRPDVIYIHNPYDKYNHVTSVHPYFYCKNLRNFTDKLVYIPYFVLNEIEPDDQAAIDGMKHFCFMPGTIYADQVILQSEKMRQIYINEYIKAAKEMGLSGEHVDRKFLEKKFLGTGSPKIDKVLNTRKEDLEIPTEWLKIIEKPDGSRKKIVFYNTSVSALLRHSEKMLRKMESVFEIFKENKDEVALLWRPHPLIKATIESMRPQLWEKYKEIRDRYIEEGWGIYDDTADMDRAVVLSDAYYGDESSIVHLYRKTGKPILMQEVTVIKKDGFESACLIGKSAEIDAESGVLWLVTNFTTTLLKVDLKNGTVVKSYQIPTDKIQDYDFQDIMKVGNDLYIVPYNAGYLYRFSIEEESFVKIDLNLTELEKEKKKKFRRALHVKNGLYLIGFQLMIVIRLDLQTLTIKRIEGFSCESSFFAFDSAVIGDDIYIPFYQENKILHITTADDTWEEIAIPNENSKGFSTIAKTEYGFMLTDLADNRIEYHCKERDIVYQELRLLSKEHLQYVKVYCYQEKNYYFPYRDSTVWRINRQGNKKALEYEYPYDDRFEVDYYTKFEMIELCENKIYFQARTNGDVFVINLDTDEVQKQIIYLSNDLKDTLLSTAAKKKYKEIVYETDIYDLNSLIFYGYKQ